MAYGALKMTYTHEAMIDLILMEPTVSTAELAEIFGFKSPWVCRIIAADSFQARLAERKGKLIDPIVAQSLNDRLRGVAIHAIDLVSEKLNSEKNAGFAMEALGVATKAMGMQR